MTTRGTSSAEAGLPEHFRHRKIRTALDESIRLNKSLEPVDAALVAAARTVAKRIDDAVAEADGQELTKALYLVPHITNLLKEMQATPAARSAVGPTPKEAPGGKLAQLRSVANRPA